MKHFRITSPTIEYVENPVGLDVREPRFAWKMAADYRGACQSAWQILVRQAGELVWDSGIVKDTQSAGIVYRGEALKPCTRYDVKINVWNEKEEQENVEIFFETGLMDGSLRAWNGAEFIGPRKCTLEASTQGLYRIDTTFSICPGGKKGGVVFGKNDLRLLDKAKNTLGMEGENYIAYMIDVSVIPAKLEIYRIGYAPEDREEVPFAVIELDGITEENRYEQHTLSIEVYGNHAKTWMDGQIVDQVKDETPMAKRMGIDRYVGRQLNPVGFNDCPTYPRLCEVGFAAEGGEVRFGEMRISNIREPKANLCVITPEQGQEYTAVVSGGPRVMVTRDPSHGAIPMVRRAFTVDPGKELASARLYATARGIYEGHVNGKKITEDLLNPGASQFDKHLYYQTYDLTGDLVAGENGIGFYLASGWWSDSQTFTLMNHNYFGDRPSLLARLVLTYKDGSCEEIVTDTEHWECSIDGPVRYASFFHGEIYDARKEGEYNDFSRAGYKKGIWEKPIVVKTHVVPSEPGPFHMWPVPNQTEPEIIGQPGDRVRHGEVKKALEMTSPVEGVYIYDMGQNMAGVPRIRVQGEAGQKVVIRFGETLYPKLEEYKGLEGLMLTENLRDAQNTDIYICKGGEEEVYMPRFTFHGYRYIEISGLSRPLSLECVESVSVTSLTKLTGQVETSNPMLNKLFENITWSQRSNFISIPTDCPQRNERMGWMGDAQVFARTASYNADVLAFFQRYLVAARDLQQEDGKYPDIAPVGGGFGGIVWESAGIIIPWEMYQQYGDVKIVAENYAAMKKYAAYLKDIFDHEKFREMYFLGDWLASDMSTDENLIWLCHYAYDIKLLSKMAGVLGEEKDAAEYKALFEGLQKKFNETFFDTKTGRTINEAGEPNDTQCSYALPLAYGIFSKENEPAAAKRLHEKTVELDYTLTTGFIGTGLIGPALTDYGYAATAYKLVQQTGYPSWLYSITQGATSIWERWNSFTFENGFGGNNAMNSFNHYSLGAIGSWMYSHMLGIQRVEEKPGFSEICLKPHMTGLDKAGGYYDSLYGRIESAWEKSENEIHYTAVIPANTRAVLYLPEGEITESGIQLKDARGICIIGHKEDHIMLTVTSGRYDFTIKK